ncbi:MAG: DUF5675 family protein [Vibrio splendidus]
MGCSNTYCWWTHKAYDGCLELITAKRTYHKHYTSSVATMPDGSEIMFLERPWLDNAIGKSCIPEGVYIIDRDHTGKHQWYKFRDEQTDPRTYIEIHPANKVSQLEGCLAPCVEIKGGDKTSEPIAVDSIKTTQKLVEWFGENSWVLKLTS